MNKRPPRYLLHFFRWFCRNDYVEDIEGDLLERYAEKIQNRGITKAKIHLLFELLKLFRPGIVKQWKIRQKLNFTDMLKHNLLITFRGFWRHKTVFGLNLIGLITSLTCVLLCAIWVNDEWRKDRFHQDPEEVFQVYSIFNNEDGIAVKPGVTGLLEAEIEVQIPQVALSAVCTDVHEYALSVGVNGFRVNGRFADEDYLKVLDYPLWRGEKEALSDPSNILITRSLAKRMFGQEDAIGKNVDWRTWNDKRTFRVAGILENIPSASSESFEFILPWTFYHDDLINFKAWNNFYGRVIVRLNDLSQKALVEEKMNEIFQSNQAGNHVELFLTNFSDRYLYSKYEDGKQAGGRIDYVHLTIAIGVFILLIACINFINLSTAFASLKVKEIGVKKSFGATKGALTFQFFFESVLLMSIASLCAVLLSIFLLEPFNQITGKQLTLDFDLTFLALSFLLVLFLGFIAGLYPALHLSALKTISALKSKALQNDMGGSGSRKTLVFIQFTLSIFLIVGTLIVGQQMDYAIHKNLGYERDNLLYFLREGKILENYQTFEAELAGIPGVKMVCRSSFSVQPGYQNRTAGISWEGKQDDQNVSFWENKGDANSVDILGLELVSGRSFDEQLANEENNIIFNEKAIEVMGLEDPIGQTVDHYLGKRKIIGVVKDFTTESLHSPIEPVMFLYRPERAHYVMIKIEKGKELATIEQIESVYKAFNPNYQFDPQFVDQDYQALYLSELQVSRLSKIFSGLAIIISGMGLFGLTIFQVQRRVKEIGIRKVLGAERWKLAFSMTFDFTKSVFLALAIALPLSYFIGLKWLENFSDRIGLSWWIFGLSAFVAISIAWLTVGSQTLRAASANPINSLRDE